MTDVKQCPYCAETIKKAAIVCKHCGRELPGYKEAAPLGVPKRKRVDADPGGERETAKRRSYVKWWLSGLGVVSAFYAHPYGGSELWGNVSVSAILYFVIGSFIDSFRVSRWKKKGEDGKQDSQTAEIHEPKTLRTY